MSDLSTFEFRASEDPVKTDLELICTRCGEHLCDAEHGDNLSVLARVAENHACPLPIHCADCGMRIWRHVETGETWCGPVRESHGGLDPQAAPLSPYDTGDVAEPHIWPPDGDPDRYGRVDFDTDDGTTVCTVRVIRDESGRHVLQVTPQGVDLTMEYGS